MSRVFNVLFLCTGNSARSILAESLMNHWGKGRFRGFSAGSFPKGTVHPLALELLRGLDLPSDGFRSKSWNEFAAPDAPPMNFVITVCDQAAGETCPVWPGHPIVAHWGVPDPAAVTGSEKERRQAFQDAFTALERRVKALVDSPLEKLDRAAAERALRAIGGTASTNQREANVTAHLYDTDELPIGERAPLAALLASAALPTVDIDMTPGRFWRFRDARGDVGFAGLEVCGADALLRSVVVPPERRGQGHGRAILAWMLDQAARLAVHRVFLLTTTAADFFAAADFMRIARDSAPASIRATSEFASLCPETALCMMKPLTPQG